MVSFGVSEVIQSSNKCPTEERSTRHVLCQSDKWFAGKARLSNRCQSSARICPSKAAQASLCLPFLFPSSFSTAPSA